MQAGWLGWGAMHQYCRALGKRTVYGVYFSPRHFSCSAQLLVASAVAPAAQGCTLAERRRSRPARAQAVDTLVARCTESAGIVVELPSRSSWVPTQWVQPWLAALGTLERRAWPVRGSQRRGLLRSDADRVFLRLEIDYSVGPARQLRLGLLGAGLGAKSGPGWGSQGTCGVPGGSASEDSRVCADIYACCRR